MLKVKLQFIVLPPVFRVRIYILQYLTIMYIIELYIVTMYCLHLLTLLSLNLLVRVELLRTFVSTKQRESS